MKSRREWHRLKLEELKEHLRTITEAWEPEMREANGPKRTVLAGIAYHRKMLELLEELALAIASLESSEFRRAGLGSWLTNARGRQT